MAKRSTERLQSIDCAHILNNLKSVDIDKLSDIKNGYEIENAFETGRPINKMSTIFNLSIALQCSAPACSSAHPVVRFDFIFLDSKQFDKYR